MSNKSFDFFSRVGAELLFFSVNDNLVAKGVFLNFPVLCTFFNMFELTLVKYLTSALVFCEILLFYLRLFTEDPLTKLLVDACFPLGERLGDKLWTSEGSRTGQFKRVMDALLFLIILLL